MKATTLDLDAFEPDNPKPPFTVILGSRSYELLAVEEVDFRDLTAAQEAVAVGRFEPMVRLLVAEEDRAEFLENRLPSFKLTALLEAYGQHFADKAPKGRRS